MSDFASGLYRISRLAAVREVDRFARDSLNVKQLALMGAPRGLGRRCQVGVRMRPCGFALEDRGVSAVKI